MKVKIYIPYDPVTEEIDWTGIKSEKPTIFNTHGSSWCWHEKEIEVSFPEIIMIGTDDWDELYLNRKDSGGDHSWQWRDILDALEVPYKSVRLAVNWDEDLGGKWPETLTDDFLKKNTRGK